MAVDAAVETMFLPRPGGRIAFDVRGDGPLLVCLPGMGDLRSTFRFVVPALVAAGHRVATVDLRGHGDSDATFDRYDDVAAGEDALALVDHLGGGPAVLIGNSMGAGAAAWAAAQRPGAVRALVLIGPFVRDAPTPALLRWAFRLAMAGPWRGAAWNSYLPKLYPGQRPGDFDEHRAAVTASLRRPAHGKAFAATTRTSHAPVERRLGEVSVPSLVVMGEADPDFADAPAEARWVADRLGSEVLLVPHAGHYPHAEYPDVVIPSVVAFLRRVVHA